MHNVPKMWFIWITLVATLVLSSCQRAGSNRGPTVTEIFDLSSKCKVLGEKLLAGNVVGNSLSQSQVSHYNPDTNHCYVRLDVSTADLNTPQEEFIRDEYLYDGQTNELLVWATWKGKRKSGGIIDSMKPLVNNAVFPTYEQTDELIRKFMADDRKP